MRIIFYRSLAGREPVREYLSGLPLRDRAAAADVLDAIREHGLQAPGVRFKQIRENFGNFMLKLGPHIVCFMSP
jgi:phage-related protein